MTCPECGAETASRIEGSTLVIECAGCGWSVATTHLDPIYEDAGTYTVRLSGGGPESREALAAVARVFGTNFLGARRIGEQGVLRGRLDHRP